MTSTTASIYGEKAIMEYAVADTAHALAERERAECGRI